MTFITHDIRHELSGLYSSSGRYYHDLTHVNALLQHLDQHRALFADPDAVEAAIWFHDAIYDSKAKDNETRSAELAVHRLSPLGPGGPPGFKLPSKEQVEKIRIMIEATTAHVIPTSLKGDIAALSDCEKFLDMDVSILAANRAEFEAYEEAVRQEYAWTDDQTWRSGRAAVLRSFLQRPRIFISDLFGSHVEDAARSNLQWSLDRLQNTAPA